MKALFAAAAAILLAAGPVSGKPTAPEDITARLEGLGERMVTLHAQGPRAAVFDAVWPSDGKEFDAVGRNLILLVSAVAHDPSEFPMRVHVRVGEHDVTLQMVGHHRGEVATGSVLRQTVGEHREDEFYLLPAALAAHPADLLVDFGNARKDFKLGAFPLNTPETLAQRVDEAPGPADPAALDRFASREFPGLALR